MMFVPHRRWEPGDYETWTHLNPTQRGIQELRTFARGTWGGEFHPDTPPAVITAATRPRTHTP
jgi:hypothetical protein